MIRQFGFEPLPLEGAYLVHPFVFDDERGEFIKEYNAGIFRKNGIDLDIRESFCTVSKKGVIRGLHFQLEKQQPKYVRCVSGMIYDVICDLDPRSKTFGRWMGFDLSGENHTAVYVPPFFGHGYLVLEDSVVSYQCGEVYYPEGDSGIIYNDSTLAIDWHTERTGGIEKLIISEKDSKLMTFEEYKRIIQK